MPLEEIILNSPLHQKRGGKLVKINVETTAAQVKTADNSTVENKLAALSGALAGQTGVAVVETIAARDALTDMKVGDQCWVKDASADATVHSGAAKYIYESAEKGWVKTAEAESMDVVVKWSDVTEKPAELDDALSKRHEHANNAVLDKLSVSGGQVAVDGTVMKSVVTVASLPETLPVDLAEGGLIIVDPAFSV